MSCISSAVRLVLWFSKVQFLKRLADRVDYYERSEVCMFSFAKQGGADIFLDHSGSTYIIPKLSLYSTGLMPPKVILIRSSLYQ